MAEYKFQTTNIKGKEYVEVNERIKYFRESGLYKNWSLESEILEMANGIVTIKATITNADGKVIATGLAQEKESSSYINKTSYIENCETSAWGRALANLGIGIDVSIASYDEVANAIHNQNLERGKENMERGNANFVEQFASGIDDKKVVEVEKAIKRLNLTIEDVKKSFKVENLKDLTPEKAEIIINKVKK